MLERYIPERQQQCCRLDAVETGGLVSTATWNRPGVYGIRKHRTRTVWDFVVYLGGFDHPLRQLVDILGVSVIA